MPITIQGNWTVQSLGKNPGALPQRFTITGAITGNGTYDENMSLPIQVTGQNWQINIQAADSYDPPYTWINSSMRATSTQVINGNYLFKIESEDLIQDNTWNDLILQLTQPVPVPPSPPPSPNIPEVPPTLPPSPNIPLPKPPEPPKELMFGRVFTKITNDDRLEKQKIRDVYGIWLDYTGSMTGNLLTFYTCSNDTGSFKKSVYSAQCFTCSSTPQFDIAYGHDGGSGSRDLGGNDFYTPSNAVYGQYRSLCLDPNVKRFKVGDREIYHFYAINIHRDRMNDRFDEGNWELNLRELSGSLFLQGNPNRNAHTGSNVKLSGTNKVIRLIDDSGLDFENLTSNSFSTFYQEMSSSKCHLNTSAGDVFFAVSGNLETGIYNPTQPHVYGLVYPQQGIIILDAELLDQSSSFLTVTGSDVNGDNAMKLFTSISGSSLITDESGDYLGFQGRKIKESYIEQFFIRIKNQEYNFTNNKTYLSGSEGDIIGDFLNQPRTYISQVGLYNDKYELLAVAKPSFPIYKDYTEEALIEVNLRYG